jgi:hypothetical protein
VGLILAHQRLQQMQPNVLDALYGATAIKFAAKISDAAAHALARDMRTTPEFILDQPPYHFAAFIRGLTDTALSIGIPATDMNKMPRMTRAEHNAVQESIRQCYSVSPNPLRSAATNRIEPRIASEATLEPDRREALDFGGDDWRS